MTLLEKQLLFFELCVKLFIWLLANGYRAKWGQTLRTIAEAAANAASGAGISHSLHLLGLAVDLLVFKDGRYLKTVEDYRPLGEYWKTLHPLCRWGGDFTKLINGEIVAAPDADHFSVEHQGVK